MLHSARPDRCTRQRGFTLVEMIVVILILALLLGLAVPRFANRDRRAFEAAAESTADLLTMFAQRDHLGVRPVGLMYTSSTHTLELVVLDTEDGTPNSRPYWRSEPLIDPVRMPEQVLAVEIVADGDPIHETTDGWQINTDPGTDRPAIQITLRGEEFMKTILLPAQAISPRMVDTDSVYDGLRVPTDLDETGRSREDW